MFIAVIHWGDTLYRLAEIEIKELQATSLESALVEVTNIFERKFDEYYTEGDSFAEIMKHMSIDATEIMEVSQKTMFDLDAWKRDREQLCRMKKDAIDREKRRQEYERLKKEFGD